MSKIVLWQMAIGTVLLVVSVLAWAISNREPNYLIMASGTALLGGGALYQIGKGGGAK